MLSHSSGSTLSLSTHLSTEGGKTTYGAFGLTAVTLCALFVVGFTLAAITMIITLRIAAINRHARAISVSPYPRNAVAISAGCLSAVGVAACLAGLLATWWTEYPWAQDAEDGGVVFGSAAAIVVYFACLVVVCEVFFVARRPASLKL